MSISSTGKAISPRQQRAKLKGESPVEVENNQGNSLNTDLEQGANVPVPEDNAKLAITGVRPIGASDLEIAEKLSIAGVRPVSTSNLEVVDTYNAMGIRPIGANTFHVADSMNLSGIRPIASSALVVAENYSIFGNRPIASNEIDHSESLMGYLD